MYYHNLYQTLLGQTRNKTTFTSNDKFFEPKPAHYPSSDGTSTWGPALWKYIHTSACYYPEHPDPQTRENMKNWLYALPDTLPCKSCSQHCKGYMNEVDLQRVCSSRATLFPFTVELHNKVNKRTHKPEMSVEEAYRIYRKSS